MAQLSANLWYEIFPATSSRAAPDLRRKATATRAKGRTKAAEPQVIQLVEDGQEPPEKTLETPTKPLKSQRSPATRRENPYRDTIVAHANWGSPAARTIKIV